MAERAANIFLHCVEVSRELKRTGTVLYANTLSWAACMDYFICSSSFFDHFITFCFSIIVALDRARQPARAVMIGEECLERREKLNMENTSEHVHSLNNLGLSLISAGQYERAIEVLQKCLIHREVHVLLECGGFFFSHCV